MVKSLATFIDSPAAGRGFLKGLVAHAKAIDADLTITIFTAAPMIATQLAPFGSLYLPEEELRADAAKDARDVRALIGDTDARVRIAGIYGDMSWLAHDMRNNAVIADLIVFGAPSTWQAPWLRQRAIETALVSGGTPLLLLPPDLAIAPIRKATLGWLPSAEAVRVAHDLVALANPRATVDVVTVGGVPEGQPEISDGPCPIADFLRGHRMKVECHWIDNQRSEDEQLQVFALAAHADVLAVGGFGHSRVREVLLGGVTRSLVAEPRVPILMAH